MHSFRVCTLLWAFPCSPHKYGVYYGSTLNNSHIRTGQHLFFPVQMVLDEDRANLSTPVQITYWREVKKEGK